MWKNGITIKRGISLKIILVKAKFCLKMDISVYCLKLKNNVQEGFSGPFEMLCIIWRELEGF